MMPTHGNKRSAFQVSLEREDEREATIRFTAIFEKQTAIAKLKCNRQTDKFKFEQDIKDSINEKIRILVAEDNFVNQKVAKIMLRKIGFRADVVANGQEAIDVLKTCPYDLVLMDCQMPAVDGYEATRRIRQEGSKVLNPCIPIIAMTASVMQSDREKCIQAGILAKWLQ
jgi:CheY-like chemotaxis protein